ncbi:MAG: hypothetical protein H6807_06080 [Planctomycetes bacterium]|nr:hypothetical protein [Planctomycetota bacterium]
MTLIIVLLLVGCALVVAEVMFPSFGILGLLSATAMLIAVLEGFAIGARTGYGVIIAIVFLVPGALWLGFVLLKHTPVGNRLLLAGPKPEEVRGRGADLGLATLRGREGRTETPLRPSGVVIIDERQIDAVSDGGFIERGQRVRVRHVEGNRVVVEVIGPEEARAET